MCGRLAESADSEGSCSYIADAVWRTSPKQSLQNQMKYILSWSVFLCPLWSVILIHVRDKETFQFQLNYLENKQRGIGGVTKEPHLGLLTKIKDSSYRDTKRKEISKVFGCVTRIHNGLTMIHHSRLRNIPKNVQCWSAQRHWLLTSTFQLKAK